MAQKFTINVWLLKVERSGYASTRRMIKIITSQAACSEFSPLMSWGHWKRKHWPVWRGMGFGIHSSSRAAPLIVSGPRSWDGTPNFSISTFLARLTRHLKPCSTPSQDSSTAAKLVQSFTDLPFPKVLSFGSGPKQAALPRLLSNTPWVPTGILAKRQLASRHAILSSTRAM